MRSSFDLSITRRDLDRRGRAGGLLLWGALAGCLTGDSLEGKYCDSDADCAVVASPDAQRLRCTGGACRIVGQDCGDGVAAAGESCDDGNQDDKDACSNACEQARCGDGIVQIGEDCDDGNSMNEDECSNTCKTVKCGDGIVQAAEECDDGNVVGDDGCSNSCRSAECGDGIVQIGEECDDGNGDANDACANCKDAVCGDGLVMQGSLSEECDDGNADDTDACTSSCTKAVCGDAFLQQGVEMCEDGNVADNDGCSWPECRLTATALSKSVGSHASNHTCAIRLGGVRCWGDGGVFQLGTGASAIKGDEIGDSPFLDVELGDARAVEVSAGGLHTCALMDSGEVKCWGSNLKGAAGIPGQKFVGDTEDEFPLAGLALGGAVLDAEGAQLAAGEQHTCVVLDGGDVVCWGDGPLGYPGGVPVEDPASAGPVVIGKPIKEIGAGTQHTCALSKDGEVFCWGDAQFGALGYGSFEDVGDDEDPAAAGPVDLGGRRAERLFVGHRSTCVSIREDEQSPRRLWCWGNNSCGKLGYWHGHDIGNDEPVPNIPVRVLEADADVEQVGLGVVQTCAALADGSVRCWGSALELGNCSPGDAGDIGDTPGEMAKRIDLAQPARDLHVGFAHACALVGKGDVHCWGRNQEGQLGVGRLGSQSKICPAAIYDTSATLDCQER